MDPDPGGPKRCGSGLGSGSTTLVTGDGIFSSAYRICICSGEGFPGSRRQRGLNAQRCDSWVWHYFQVFLVVCAITVVLSPDPYHHSTMYDVCNQESVFYLLICSFILWILFHFSKFIIRLQMIYCFTNALLLQNYFRMPPLKSGTLLNQIYSM